MDAPLSTPGWTERLPESIGTGLISYEYRDLLTRKRNRTSLAKKVSVSVEDRMLRFEELLQMINTGRRGVGAIALRLRRNGNHRVFMLFAVKILSAQHQLVFLQAKLNPIADWQ